MKDQKGAALVSVLALVATCSIIAATISLLSSIHTVEIDTHCKRSLSRYTAESAMNRIIWLTAADKQLFSDSTPGATDYDSYDHDRYVPDSVEHIMEYRGAVIKFTIEDACTGLNPTSLQSGLLNLQRNRETDTAISDALADIMDIAADYSDSDDTVSAAGMESDDYDFAGFAPLPRNNEPQFREELLWLEGSERVFPIDRYGRLSSVMTLAAAYTYGDNQLPHLYTATYTELITTGTLTPQEACTVLEALERWKKYREPLEDTLDGTLYSSLQNTFRRNNSGMIRITITHAAPEEMPSVRLSTTLPMPDNSLPENGRQKICEWLWL